MRRWRGGRCSRDRKFRTPSRARSGIGGPGFQRPANLVGEHRTNLIFVNTRRLAERVTRHLSDLIGEENVAAHHGSLAKEQRLDAEQRLKHGKLKALVATASLELGIDIGGVDLVCQLGSPRSIASFLRRVGRSGHAIDGTPKGRLFPLSRHELVECAALVDNVRRGELDGLTIPCQPLDVDEAQANVQMAKNAGLSPGEINVAATEPFRCESLGIGVAGRCVSRKNPKGHGERNRGKRFFLLSAYRIL